MTKSDTVMAGSSCLYIALCNALIAAVCCDSPSVTISRPKQTERLNSKKVDFEVNVAGLQLPSDGMAQLYINDVLALNITQNRVVVAAPLESGFHKAHAVLNDTSGNLISRSQDIHFLVDVSDVIESTAERISFLPKEPGRVSVIIASHDRFEMLMDSIESVRRQTYEDWEIIVVNDASTDPRYYTLIEDVTMIHLPYNIGRPGLVRNVGISAASGEYVAFLDDDDVWLPNKLQRQLEVMEQRGVNMSCSDALAGNGSFVQGKEYQRWLRDAHGPYAVRMVMEGARHFGEMYDMERAVREGHCFHVEHCLPDVWDWYLLVRANFVITTSFLAKRDLLFAAGPFNNKTLGEDHDLWKNCLRLSRLAFVREPLVYWRIDSPDKLTQSWKD
uniref:Glycosyltransferase 2-like domain-containing protein n=1 Tax=Guillardia theta TaxID=55529 RepID=A0A7S4PPM5_GUITH|mmetsp:Transcript_8666/g.28903  ORF Transcript_8666/g.28903 Transcript_8666/m.28903 type:complete len:388 (+) Transcript_8666:122-1285(+)